MSFDYSEIVSTADELLTEYGRPIELTREFVGTYDPATSSAAIIESSYTANGVVLSYSTKDIDGTLIRKGDKQLLLSAAGQEPMLNDTLVESGIKYTIVDIDSISPAGIPVLFKCNIRK